jgi:hypothetical protein
LRAQAIIFFLCAVAPDDIVWLRQRSNISDPADQLLMFDIRGRIVAPMAALSLVVV